MTKEKLNQFYFEWLCRFAGDGREEAYQDLLSCLHGMEFTYIFPLDGNRAEDGIDLRYRFGRECRYDDAMVASLLDDRPCSVLEMMIALALRCEEHIMEDPDLGNRTGVWFWEMVDSLGLSEMADGRFDSRRANDSLSRFLERKYCPNGKGGLFTVENCRKDLRSMEIWYQMCWYLDEMLYPTKGDFIHE